jgi:uncharacterized protein (TIGR02597 family)
MSRGGGRPIALLIFDCRGIALSMHRILWIILFVQPVLGLDGTAIQMPVPGAFELRILSPTLLELSLVTTKEPDPAPVSEWNFVGANFVPSLPGASQFQVTVENQAVAVAGVGFRRRPLYAPLRTRDLRIGNYLYLALSTPIENGQTVVVGNADGSLWDGGKVTYQTVMNSMRWNPALHVNQVGYMPDSAKKAMVGYYLGSLGEMEIAESPFYIVRSSSGEVVFTGQLRNRPDVGYTYTPAPYQNVMEADFSAFTTVGEYRLQVPGMGVSFPFLINGGVAATFARTYALGLYHQRCGGPNELPHTRHEHGICHSAPASIPTLLNTAVNNVLAGETWNYSENPLHTAPRLGDVDSSLYPFVNTAPIDVSGGHHDAGDYSKYTINSAGLIHHLVFAADSFPDAARLDNLGLPESHDGKSDLLQEAKCEADFLAKMQDADGGFYFLVYPRDRRYEDDVLPDQGDPQVVFPKTTAATAAAVGALAEIASSPTFRTQFPAEAAAYLQKARLGWAFLMQAIALHGKNGAYQKITHYGNEFMHDDELAWAAAALFAATGEEIFHDKLREWYDPENGATRRWSWWRLFEGYGCAARAYAFAARSGRLAPALLDPSYLAKCEAEIVASGDDIARFAEQTAYGSSFPDPNKSFRTAGWFFSSERAFELAVAHQLAAKPAYLDAVTSNFGYEAGCNPVNVSYITGLGWKRWREIVHQYALNDQRVLPPSGLPLGNIQGGFPYLENYKQELGALCFPPDGAAIAPYPFYDRWGDTFNTTTEFVVMDQARALGTASFLLARTGDFTSLSQGTLGTILGLPSSWPAGENVTASLQAPGIDLSEARIVWETKDGEPRVESTFTFAAKNPGDQWIEVEAQMPDGRRVFARGSFSATFPVNVPPNAFQPLPVSGGPEVAALYHFDSKLSDATGRNGDLALLGNATFNDDNLGWMRDRGGSALRIYDLGDMARVTVPASLLYTNGIPSEITLEAMIYVHAFKGWNREHANIVTLVRNWNASLEFMEDIYSGVHFRGGSQFDVFGVAVHVAFPIQQWQHISITIDASGYSARVNGQWVASVASAELAGWSQGSATLELGNFDGWIDEVVIRTGPLTTPAPPPSAVPVSEIAATSENDAGFYFRLTTPGGEGQVVECNDAFPNGEWRLAPGNEISGEYGDPDAPNVRNRIYRVRSGAQISEFAGFHRFKFMGRADTLFSLPFVRPAEAIGTVAETAGQTLRISGGSWTDNQWAYASGTQSNTYFALFGSGARRGEYFTIVANGSDSLELDLEGASLAGAAPGDDVAIIPYWTMGTVFPAGRGIHASPAFGPRTMEVFFPNLASVGVNLSPNATYYFRNGDWRRVGGGSGSRNDDVILPDMYVIVRNNRSLDTEVTTHGAVLQTPFRLRLRRNSSGSQDNFLALPRPCAITLNESGLIASGAFQPSLSIGRRTDELFVFGPQTATINRSPTATYYHRNGTWRKIGGGYADVGNDPVFTPGTGFIIRAGAGADASVWENIPSY